jgi:hypothetical protein
LKASRSKKNRLQVFQAGEPRQGQERQGKSKTRVQGRELMTERWQVITLSYDG